MDTKICIKCGAELDLSPTFGNRKASKDGLSGKCKECKAEYHKEYAKKNKDAIEEYHKEYYEKNKEAIAEDRKQYRKENKEKIAEYKKIYQQENKDVIAVKKKIYNEKNKEVRKIYNEKNKEDIAKTKKLWDKENKEHRSEYRKKHYIENREYSIQCSLQWSKNNKEKCCINEERRRSRKLELPATLTEDQWKEIKIYFNNKCSYCGKEKLLVQEHFIALSKGGEYTHKNIIPACKNCNSSKGPKDFLTWYPKYRYYSKDRELKIIEYIEGLVG